MEERADMASRLLIQRMDDLSSTVGELRKGQVEAASRANETAIQIERILGEIRSLNSLAETVKAMATDVDEHEVRLCLIEELNRTNEERRKDQRHEERLTKMEGWQMKMIGIMAAIVVIAQLCMGVLKIFWGK